MFNAEAGKKRDVIGDCLNGIKSYADNVQTCANKKAAMKFLVSPQVVALKKTTMHY